MMFHLCASSLHIAYRRIPILQNLEHHFQKRKVSKFPSFAGCPSSLAWNCSIPGSKTLHSVNQGALLVSSPPPGWAPEVGHLGSHGVKPPPAQKISLEERGVKKKKDQGRKRHNMKKQTGHFFLMCGENKEILLADPSSWWAKYHYVPCWLRVLVARERMCTHANPYKTYHM